MLITAFTFLMAKEPHKHDLTGDDAHKFVKEFTSHAGFKKAQDLTVKFLKGPKSKDDKTRKGGKVQITFTDLDTDKVESGKGKGCWLCNFMKRWLSK